MYNFTMCVTVHILIEKITNHKQMLSDLSLIYLNICLISFSGVISSQAFCSTSQQAAVLVGKRSDQIRWLSWSPRVFQQLLPFPGKSRGKIVPLHDGLVSTHHLHASLMAGICHLFMSSASEFFLFYFSERLSVSKLFLATAFEQSV